MPNIDEILELCERATPGPWVVETEYMTEAGYEQFIKRQAVTTTEELVEEDGEEPHTVKYSIARMDWSNPVTANAQFIAAARTLLPQLAAEYRKAMEVVNAAQCRQMLINNRRELRLRNRPGEFIPELGDGDLIVSIGQADIRLEQALAGLERGGE